MNYQKQRANNGNRWCGSNGRRLYHHAWFFEAGVEEFSKKHLELKQTLEKLSVGQRWKIFIGKLPEKNEKPSLLFKSGAENE